MAICLLACLLATTPAEAAVWYVNDTSTAGDSFTSAIGDDTNNGLTPSTPKRTIAAVMPLLTAGDTVYIDAGTYYPADTIIIETNAIALIGKDSASTIIDFNDSSAGASRGIDASGLKYLTFRDFQVKNGWWAAIPQPVDFHRGKIS